MAQPRDGRGRSPTLAFDRSPTSLHRLRGGRRAGHRCDARDPARAREVPSPEPATPAVSGPCISRRGISPHAGVDWPWMRTGTACRRHKASAKAKHQDQHEGSSLVTNTDRHWPSPYCSPSGSSPRGGLVSAAQVRAVHHEYKAVMEALDLPCFTTRVRSPRVGLVVVPGVALLAESMPPRRRCGQAKIVMPGIAVDTRASTEASPDSRRCLGVGTSPHEGVRRSSNPD